MVDCAEGYQSLLTSTATTGGKHGSGVQSAIFFRLLRTRTSALLTFLLLPLVYAADREWHPEAEFNWAPLTMTGPGRTGFTLLSSAQTGIAFTNWLEEGAAASNRVLLNGSGVAAGDYDNDGWVDLYFCGLNRSNALYKNLGNWKFREATAEAGLTTTNLFSRGAVFADLDGDGWQDLLVSAVGAGVLCFMNNGDGTFTNGTQQAGTGSRFASTTLALADIDGNGSLDLYVANNRNDDIRDRGQVNLNLVKGEMVVPPALQNRLVIIKGQVQEYGEPDLLLLNDGRGRFKVASWITGRFLDEQGNALTKPPLDWGLTAAFHDLNGDGFPDIYVCNDFWTPDRIWINDGKGNFRAMDRLAVRCTSGSSMGVDFADIDRDGFFDFIVMDMRSRDLALRKRQVPSQMPALEMTLSPLGLIDNRPQSPRNTLFHNRGDGTFEEIANFAGVAATDWSWQPIFLDVDLDGYEDLLVTSGHPRDVQDADADRLIQSRQHSWKGWTNAVERQKAFTRELLEHMRFYPRFDSPIFAFRNAGGLKFSDQTAAWGTDQKGVHHGIALADLDNDGDLDLAVNNFESNAGLYRNETVAPRVAVWLKGKPPNRQGIGAKVTLRNGAVPAQTAEMVSGGRYLSGGQAMLVFAAGAKTEGLTLEVEWRSGRRTVLGDVRANRIYQVVEGDGSKAPAPERQTGPGPGVAASTGPPLFEDVSERIQHNHHETAFDDFARQNLLPKRLSQFGPGIGWFDLNGDGWDDLVIPTGQGGKLAVFMNNGKGGFAAREDPALARPAGRDQTGLAGWAREDGQATLLVGAANYEDGSAAGTPVQEYLLAKGVIEENLPGHADSTGPVALGDLDGDGDLDLFMGGRVVPGRYPEPSSSYLFRSAGGKWELDVVNSRKLAKIGLVSGAVWSDLDGDGLPELILACEWGPIRVFRNRAGMLQEATSELGLDRYSGLWNSVTTVDLDGDGQFDIVAGNWGLNSNYGEPRVGRSIRIYYGELLRPGTVDLIEAEYDERLRGFASTRRMHPLARSMPFLTQVFASHRAYSEANIDALLAPVKGRASFVEASTLASMVFFNRLNRLEPRELPPEAQLAPAFGISVLDYDGDGSDDLFLSQNFFAMEAETPRLDAGRGLLLRNDGKGVLQAVPGQRSGVKIYGEQRGSAVADYDHDGRPDLAVAQNGAATRLLRNLAGKPGWRVRLRGPAGNPNGIGASLQLISRDQRGPARELHAGSGYWSQDSATVVLGSSVGPSEIRVRWPGGKTTTTVVPAGSRELIINQEGKLE